MKHLLIIFCLSLYISSAFAQNQKPLHFSSDIDPSVWNGTWAVTQSSGNPLHLNETYTITNASYNGSIVTGNVIFFSFSYGNRTGTFEYNPTAKTLIFNYTNQYFANVSISSTSLSFKDANYSYTLTKQSEVTNVDPSVWNGTWAVTQSSGNPLHLNETYTITNASYNGSIVTGNVIFFSFSYGNRTGTFEYNPTAKTLIFNYTNQYFANVSISSTSLSFKDANYSYTLTKQFIFLPPSLSSPTNGGTGISTAPILIWNKVTGATSYTLQVSQNNNFSSFVLNQVIIDTSKQIIELTKGITYYWRVNALNHDTSSGWSNTCSFTTVTSLSHFAVTYMNTGNNATVLIQTTTSIMVNNNPFTLSTGDEIAIYTPSPDTICCGLRVWNGSNMAINVWGDNIQTATIKEGFTSGQTYIFRLWDASESKEYSDAEVTFSNGSSTYSSNAISIVSVLNFTTFVELLLPLPSGWNFISSNVIPQFLRIDSIFQNIVSKIVIVKNVAGEVYWPRYGINDIGNWNIVEGYRVYMSASDTLKMRGQRANPSTPLSLLSGWSMIAYLPNVPISPARACSSLTGKIVIMKDVSGKVYWPRYNIDQIGTMQAGKGYQIYLSGAGTLVYPAASTSKERYNLAEGRNHGQLNPQHFAYIRGTGSNATILVMMNGKSIINRTALEVGDEIGVFTPEGVCAGAGVWNGDDIVITVWGDNGETMNIDGFTDGQAYNFKLWDKSAVTEKDISVIAESGNLMYSENGITIISYEKSSALPDNFILRQNYPNPFNPTTRIEYQIKEQSEVTLAIYNTAGQLIRMLVNSSQPAGVYSVVWDGKNSSGVQVPSGIYLYRLQAGGAVETRKMVVMK